VKSGGYIIINPFTLYRQQNEKREKEAKEIIEKANRKDFVLQLSERILSRLESLMPLYPQTRQMIMNILLDKMDTVAKRLQGEDPGIIAKRRDFVDECAKELATCVNKTSTMIETQLGEFITVWIYRQDTKRNDESSEFNYILCLSFRCYNTPVNVRWNWNCCG
jgi:hypothetical protein